jgi:hypothetical protein
MFYGGMTNVPGAPGNLLAGSPGYFMPDAAIQDKLFRYGMDNTEKGKELKNRIENIRKQAPITFGMQAQLPGEAGNLGALAQVNPTYPPGDPRYGDPMLYQGQPMSMNEAEFNWSQRMNQLRREDPGAYKKIQGMMGPFGWGAPPAGFTVPPGI